MKNNDVIEPSSSPWASPIVLVRKKDGSTRFCVDYRRLNDVTKKDSYPLPRIDDTLDTLAGNTWFSTLDLKSGYWQVELHPDDKEKTAFITGQGLGQFKVMPFGLCNAPATFERLMETILGGLSYDAYLVYLDAIIIVGRSFEEHLKNIRRVLQKLKEANLKLSPSKCHIFRREEYDVEICHRKGSAHGNADALSRRPCPESCKYCSRIEKKFGVIDPIVRQVTTPSTSTLDPWSDESVQKDQLADPEIKPIIEFKESSEEKPS
ncbi:hypothetical protein TNCV_684901 [Trichonephila clavipes]|nr:hypothetical protein TNCV_684901 [Trichonephila clavipes]